MEFLHHFIDFFLHIDHHLASIVEHYGTITYLILFIIIFCETGLVVTPFLPGDSLLFVIGALSASGSLSLGVCLLILSVAAILGNISNYFIGRLLASKIIRFIKKEYLDRTQHFYEKYGAKTIILSRFLPIIRTFAPFLAGVGKMPYPRFLLYNLIGGIAWIFLFLLGGYYFGNLPIVKKNFSLVVMAIIIISIIPAVVEYFKAQKKS